MKEHKKFFNYFDENRLKKNLTYGATIRVLWRWGAWMKFGKIGRTGVLSDNDTSLHNRPNDIKKTTIIIAHRTAFNKGKTHTE